MSQRKHIRWAECTVCKRQFIWPWSPEFTTPPTCPECPDAPAKDIGAGRIVEFKRGDDGKIHEEDVGSTEDLG